MTPLIDRIYEYEGYHGRPARCRLRIFTDPDRPTVVLVSELPDNPGTSVTNRAAYLHGKVAAEFRLDPSTLLWIEHYTDPDRYRRVTFRPIRWQIVSPEWVAALLEGGGR